jgi:hypothetical protein
LYATPQPARCAIATNKTAIHVADKQIDERRAGPERK